MKTSYCSYLFHHSFKSLILSSVDGKIEMNSHIASLGGS